MYEYSKSHELISYSTYHSDIDYDISTKKLSKEGALLSSDLAYNSQMIVKTVKNISP